MKDIPNKCICRGFKVMRILSCSQECLVLLLLDIRNNLFRVARCYDTRIVSLSRCIARTSLFRLLIHPSIPALYGDVVLDHYYIVMEEFIAGESLEAFVLHHRLSLKQFNRICIGLLGVFEYLHSRSSPVYFLDIKPEHVFFDGNKIILVDFGASVIGGYTTGQRQATIRYAPPELLSKGPFTADATADIFGLGRTMLFLTQNMDSSVIPEMTYKIIRRACEFEPSMRYPNIAAMSEDFYQTLTCTYPDDSSHISY